MVDIDETLIDGVVDDLLGIIQTLIEAFGSVIFRNLGRLIQGSFSNSVGVLMIAATLGGTAYMVMRRSQ